MKKVLLLTFVVGAAVFTACTKDYTCECTVLGQTVSETWTDIKKSEAKDSCDAANAAVTLFGGSCELN